MRPKLFQKVQAKANRLAGHSIGLLGVVVSFISLLFLPYPPFGAIALCIGLFLVFTGFKIARKPIEGAYVNHESSAKVAGEVTALGAGRISAEEQAKDNRLGGHTLGLLGVVVLFVSFLVSTATPFGVVGLGIGFWLVYMGFKIARKPIEVSERKLAHAAAKQAWRYVKHSTLLCDICSSKIKRDEGYLSEGNVALYDGNFERISPHGPDIICDACFEKIQPAAWRGPIPGSSKP